MKYNAKISLIFLDITHFFPQLPFDDEHVPTLFRKIKGTCNFC